MPTLSGRPPRPPLRWPSLFSLALAAGVAGGARSYRRRARRLGRVATTYRWEDPAPAQRCGPLVARRAGRAGPPVILIHGLAASARTFGAGFDALGATHRVLVPDLLGFGDSPRPAGGYSLADHAEAVLSCARAAGMDDEPAMILGHSLGAAVAVTMTHRHPGMVRRLVLVSPPIYRTREQARQHLVDAVTRLERLLLTDTPLAGVICRAVCMRRPSLARRAALLYRPELPPPIALDGVRHSWTSYSQSLAGLLSADARPEWLLDAGIPVHIITGGTDRLPDLPLLRELAARSPQVTLEEIRGADHLVPLSHPERCLAAIAPEAAGALEYPGL